MARVGVLDPDDESHRRYQAALARLPDLQRAAVVYRLHDELSYDAIADKLGVATAASARVAVRRAVLQLAALMGADDRPVTGWLAPLGRWRRRRSASR
jgi:DNA-directed RNA polymerase specialized sigma24 family protein